MDRKIYFFLLTLIFGLSGLEAMETDFCPGLQVCQGKNPKLKNIKSLQVGSRGRFSPDNSNIVFDRFNLSDGFYDLYFTDLEGNLSGSLTEGNPSINQRNNGNAIYHSNGDIIIFVSEEPEHILSEIGNGLGVTDPGRGFFSNLWATDPNGNQFWKLTNVPPKMTLDDGLPYIGVVNPELSPDGRTLLWTERYAPGGTPDLNWGLWRIKAADLIFTDGVPQLQNERVLIDPAVDVQGKYVTGMDFLSDDTIILAGNMNGQHEYGMDQYAFHIPSKQLVNLTESPLFWEEGSAVAPNRQIIYMTNQDSPTPFDFTKDYTTQPIERDYYIMDSDGNRKEKLTYFNDPTAP